MPLTAIQAAIANLLKDPGFAPALLLDLLRRRGTRWTRSDAPMARLLRITDPCATIRVATCEPFVWSCGPE